MRLGWVGVEESDVGCLWVANAVGGAAWGGLRWRVGARVGEEGLWLWGQEVAGVAG